MNSTSQIFAQGAAFALSLLLIAGFVMLPALESNVCPAPAKLYNKWLVP